MKVLQDEIYAAHQAREKAAWTAGVLYECYQCRACLVEDGFYNNDLRALTRRRERRDGTPVWCVPDRRQALAYAGSRGRCKACHDRSW